MNDDGDQNIWWPLRRTALLHPRQARQEIAALLQPGFTPWYADARPLRLIQHWAPDPTMPITMCGRWAGERSTDEIRTVIGWHCRKCHRRAKSAMRANASSLSVVDPAASS
jgi:hypothetical protein